MKITLSKKEKQDLDFILSEFVNTHLSENNIYKTEIEVATKIIKLLEKRL